MRKRILSMVLAVLMLVSLVPVQVFAVDYNTVQTYKTDLDGTATGVSSNGFTKAALVWKDRTARIT